MKAVVLCGGRGERLMPMTDRRPAALLRLCGKELLLYTLEMLEKAGFDEAVLAVGYGSVQTERLLDEKYSGKMNLHIINTAGLATAQAVRAAMNDENEVLVAECNLLCGHSIDEFMAEHSKHDALCTALTFDFDTENAPSGIYIVKRELFDSFNLEKAADMTGDIIPETVKSGDAVLVSGKGYYKRITTPEAFLDCQRHMLYEEDMSKRLTDSNFSGAAISEPVYIGKNVTIMSGTVVESGSVIDDNAVVKGGKVNGYVGVGTVVSERCEIDRGVVCRGAVLDSGVKCGAYSVIGEKAHIGSEAVIEKGVGIWSGKTVDKGARLYDNVRNSRGSRLVIDENGECSLWGGEATAQKALLFGLGAASALRSGSSIVTACGSDESLMLKQALDCGICQAGVNVCSIGRAGISELSYAVHRFGCELGILIGANISGHAAVISAGGMLPDEKLLDHIENVIDDRAFRSVSLSKMGFVSDFSAVGEIYAAELERILPDRFKGVNVDIRTYDVKKARLADRLFHGRNDIYGERIIFNLSADGTKTSAYNDKTGYVMWEKLAAMYAGVCFEKGLAVALPENFPSSADTAAERYCGRLYRYQNSSDVGADVAVQPHNMFVYDGLYLAAAVAAYLSDNGISLQKALSGVPDAFTSSRFVGITVSRENREKIFSRLGCSSDGEITKGSTHAVIRPLRDKRGITVFAESVSCEQAAAVCEDISRKIKSICSSM